MNNAGRIQGSPPRKRPKKSASQPPEGSRSPRPSFVALVSPFANHPSSFERASVEQPENNDSAQRRTLSPSPAFDVRPFQRDSRGFWKHGFHQGVKSQLPAPQGLVEPSEVISFGGERHSTGTAAPSAVFITQLDNGEGQTYHITQALAEGACGKFRIAACQGEYLGVKEYRLRDRGLGHTLAVSIDDIEREWAACQAHNPQIRVHDALQAGEKIFVMTDLLGQDLTAASRRVSPDRRALFARAAILDMGQILVKMHACKEVHLDVKPANALVGPGFVTVCDFGLATTVSSLGSGRAACGTPAFFAPERWLSLVSFDASIELDDRVDVWSIAISWCHMHEMTSPFDNCDVESLGRSLQCVTAYENFLAEISLASGGVNKDLIRHRANRRLSAEEERDAQTATSHDFYVWANSGLRVDQDVFAYLLSGPLQASPTQRPAMLSVVNFLHNLLTPYDMNVYSAVTHRLVAASEYHLDRRSTTPSTPSSRRSCTLKKIKSDLQASFGEAP